ncbi:MAG: hypothetical protein ACYC2T_08425 [Bacillota bacterium]
MVEFKPGEEQEFEFTFHGQLGKDSKLEAKIEPVPLSVGDSDWSNNTKIRTVLPKAVPEAPRAPEETVDLAATITTGIGVLKVGASATISATLYNSSSEAIQTTYVWRVNGATRSGPTPVTIPAGSQVKVGYKFTMPDVPSLSVQNIEVEVNPAKSKPTWERSWTNNKSYLSVKALKDTASDGNLTGPILTR